MKLVFSASSDIKHLEAHLEDVRRRHDQSRDPIVQQMTSLSETSRLVVRRFLVTGTCFDTVHCCCCRMRAQSADETVATLDRSASNLQQHIERSRDSQKRVEESVKETLKRCVLTTPPFKQCQAISISVHSILSFLSVSSSH